MFLKNTLYNNPESYYNGEYFQQHEGTAMNNSLSPFITHLFMSKFETEVKDKFEYFPRVWIRYVDDIVATFLGNPKDKMDNNESRRFRTLFLRVKSPQSIDGLVFSFESKIIKFLHQVFYTTSHVSDFNFSYVTHPHDTSVGEISKSILDKLGGTKFSGQNGTHSPHTGQSTNEEGPGTVLAVADSSAVEVLGNASATVHHTKVTNEFKEYSCN
ncbi:hypothetical protein NQ318_022144 [Aromia moschata]|uniref:Reverse transcriptase domain-containing protein n=1 Tax=Aromia moschata TaxID=1265417 RepID=A0AAV8Z6P3_9CUCU|nr:hypothetical protein NQ318_022144 [Aromia moschata]